MRSIFLIVLLIAINGRTQNITNKLGGTSSAVEFRVTDSADDIKFVVQADGKVGIGDASPTYTLDLTGKLGIRDIQTIYLPDQTDFKGSFIIGKGGGSISHTSGNQGYYNTAVGLNALISLTTGCYNTALGDSAMYNHTSSWRNTAIGFAALHKDVNGVNNTACGMQAMYGNLNGDNNTAVGYLALGYNTAGYYNTAVGVTALFSNTTGDGNTAIGYDAGPNGSLVLENTGAFGYQARVTASNRISIGNTSVGVIAGQVGFSTYSDARFKRKVCENVAGLDFILKLRPISFQWDLGKLNEQLGTNGEKEDSEDSEKARIEQESIRYSGFLAQEVEKAAKECNYNFSGVQAPPNDRTPYTVRYSDFVMPLVKAVQEQQEQINELRKENARLKLLASRLDFIEKQLGIVKQENKTELVATNR